MRTRPAAVARTALLSLVVAGALGGCIIEHRPSDVRPKPFTIDNRRDEGVIVDVAGLPATDTRRHETVFAQQIGLLDVRTCVGTGVVAKSPWGGVIARVDHPVCPGDVWTFNKDGTDQYVVAPSDQRMQVPST